MSKLKELHTTSDIVKEILQEYPYARNSDDFLYYKVCETINIRLVNLPFSTVILERKRLGFPAFESVRRTRQKIQASFPELAGNTDVEAQRKINEEAYKEYARGYYGEK